MNAQNDQELWEVLAYSYVNGEKKLRQWISGVTPEKARDIHEAWWLSGYAEVQSRKK